MAADNSIDWRSDRTLLTDRQYVDQTFLSIRLREVIQPHECNSQQPRFSWSNPGEFITVFADPNPIPKAIMQTPDTCIPFSFRGLANFQFWLLSALSPPEQILVREVSLNYILRRFDHFTDIKKTFSNFLGAMHYQGFPLNQHFNQPGEKLPQPPDWLKTGQNFGLQFRGELPTFSIMSELIEGLPDAVALRCLERVPFYLHPKLEQVSHSWRAVVQSTELFKVRQEVNSAEEFLCVCAYDPENLWQLYDPLRDLWISLPVLPTQVRHLAYFGVVATAGKLFVLGGGSDAVCSWWWQTYDKDRQCWTVYEGSWLQGPMAVVQGEVYVMSHGLIHKQVGQETKAVISASEFRRRIGFAMIGLGDDIYVIGGVIGPEQWNWDIKMVSDVDVLTLGSERPIWRQASPMNRCRGTVFGCTRLRI